MNMMQWEMLAIVLPKEISIYQKQRLHEKY